MVIDQLRLPNWGIKNPLQSAHDTYLTRYLILVSSNTNERRISYGREGKLPLYLYGTENSLLSSWYHYWRHSWLNVALFKDLFSLSLDLIRILNSSKVWSGNRGERLDLNHSGIWEPFTWSKVSQNIVVPFPFTFDFNNFITGIKLSYHPFNFYFNCS